MTPRKTTRLRQLIARPELAFLMEAHSGLSARIVEEAGFEGVWGSGLTISAAFGVRDNNELSWSQVVDHVAFMVEATSVPLLLDGDTGYGNFNNMRRLVRKLEQVGVAGVTIEDKLFPKTNSFLRSERQPLADMEEFCGKIKAGKDSQSDPDFVLVARVEALIAGWGLTEAIKRAEAYHAAGADAILIHSKESSPAEIFAFLDAWDNRAPVVLVPTKYWRTPTEEFRARRVGVVIWANHVLRASITAMQATAARLHQDAALLNVEPHVAPLHEVFRLQGDEELQAAEERYLPAARGGALSAVVLAAGAWSGGLEGLPRAIPVRPIKGQMVALRPPAESAIRRIVSLPGAYCVPRDDGRVLVGATVEDVGFDERSTVEGVNAMTSAVRRVLPAAAAASIDAVRVGLRPASPDGLPFIGPLPGLPAVILAAGHYRNGILLLPLTADLVARLLLDDDVDPALSVTDPGRLV